MRRPQTPCHGGKGNPWNITHKQITAVQKYRITPDNEQHNTLHKYKHQSTQYRITLSTKYSFSLYKMSAAE